jgi:high affinity sulfate transporter 1
MNIARWVSGLVMLRTYQVAWLPHDLAAGLTLGAVMVPVGLAYGELSGLPLAGLYSSMMPLLAYALFGSSRQLVVGPDSAMAAIVAAVLVPLALGDKGADAGRLAVLAASLGIMVGVLCLLAGALRLGFLADFLSKPVIVGFMHGLALVIAGSQLPKVLGVKSSGETTLEQIGNVVQRLPETNRISLTIGAACFVVILLLRRFMPRVPGAVVALIGSGVAVATLGLDRMGVAIIGHVPTGLPAFMLPALTLGDFETLLPIALVTALVSFSDTMIAARAFAARNRYRIDANQELLALGVANLASGVSQGLPISASDSRTAVAEAAGSRTQVTSFIAALVVAAAMLWLGGLLYHLPAAALGGILIAAAWGLCDFREFARLWRFRGVDLVGALLTLAGVVAMGVMEGILLGVVYSLVMILRAIAFPPDAVLGRAADGSWHDPAHRSDVAPVPGLLVYRFSAPLFFANSNLFRDRLEAQIAAAVRPVTAVVVDCGAIHDVDLMACEMLHELYEELAGRGVRLAFGELRDRVKREIERALGSEGPDPTYPTVAAAVHAIAVS